MSGSVGHQFIAAVTALTLRGHADLPVAGPVVRCPEHARTGAYLGADIQIMPDYVCGRCGALWGIVRPDFRCTCGTPAAQLQRFTFEHDGREWGRRSVQQVFYGRTHACLANDAPGSDRDNLPWAELPKLAGHMLQVASRRPSHLANATYPATNEEAVSWVVGWVSHIVQDNVVKDTVDLGVEYDILDGKYGPQTRVAYEWLILTSFSYDLGLDPAGLLYTDTSHGDNGLLTHYLMVEQPSAYASLGMDGRWPARPEQRSLAEAVQRENRRYINTLQLTSQLFHFYAGTPTYAQLRPTHVVDVPVFDKPYPELLSNAIAGRVGTGFRQTIDHVIAVLREAQRVAPIEPLGAPPEPGPLAAETWLAALEQANPQPRAAGDEVHGDTAAALAWIEAHRARTGVVIAPPTTHGPLRELAQTLADRLGWPITSPADAAAHGPAVVVGGPMLNPLTAQQLSPHEALSLKYRERYEAAVSIRGERCYLAAFSDYGDRLLLTMLTRHDAAASSNTTTP